MRIKFIIQAALAIAVTFTLALAKDFWEKPYKEWKKAEVFKMLSDSPWSKSQTVVSTVGGRGGGAVGGNQELYSSVTVRFFSALPIRQAHVRLAQLMNNYDTRTEAEKANIDATFSVALKRDFSKVIVVAVEFASNDQETRMNVARYLEQQKADHLKQSCYLISGRLGRIALAEYYPPSGDATGAKFFFPRIVGDKPVIAPEDKEATFDMWLEPINQKVFIRFKVKDLMYGGELAF